MIVGVLAVVAVAVGMWWFSAVPGNELGLPSVGDASRTELAMDAARNVQDMTNQRAQQIGEVMAGETVGVESKEVAEFGTVVPFVIGDASVWASVATTSADRVRGLSGTTVLPADVVKLFVFDAPGPQSIWMKDMQYSIDIVWLDENGKVIHVAERVSPDTYPRAFSSEQPAVYVVEAVAGFVSTHGIRPGTVTELPDIIAGI